MKETTRSFARNTKVDNALDIASKNRGRIKKLQTFDWSYFYGRKYFIIMDGKIIECFNRFIILSQDQLLIVEQSLHENPKDCQIKSLSLLLYQVIILLQN